MTDGRDRQRSKLYAWEERFVAPHDASSITFAQAQGMVDAIWADMGLRFPPKVERLPGQARATLADANRLSIRLANASHWTRPASKSIPCQSQSSLDATETRACPESAREESGSDRGVECPWGLRR